MVSDGATPRLRGRAGVEQRNRRFVMFPACVECKKLGRLRKTAEIDHVIPLSQGGSDTDDNVQGLCLEHHAQKSALEDTSHHAASNHPDWLRPSAIPVTIVCGPPCGGKTTHVQASAKAHDTIIDLDTIIATLRPSYTHWTGALDTDLLNKAIRVRNAMLGGLSRATSGRAWFIVAAPTEAERRWWQARLGGEVTLLHPGEAECKRRADQRGTPKAKAGVDQWERAARRPWAKTSRRSHSTKVGADGIPTDPNHPFNRG